MHSEKYEEDGQERIEKIKGIAHEILSECEKFSKSCGEMVCKLQRKLHGELQEVEKRQLDLQQTLTDLKNTNQSHLEKRQAVLREVEDGAEEIERLKEKGGSLESQVAAASTRRRGLMARTHQCQQEIQSLRRTLEASVTKEEALSAGLNRKLEMYKKYFGLEISLMESGYINFIFTNLARGSNARHNFVVNMESGYEIMECSLSPAQYEEPLKTLREAGNFFVFLKAMRRLFCSSLGEEKEN